MADNSIIHGLSNHAYHHEIPYSDYLSSSGLKRYMISPKAYRYAVDNPEDEKSDALRFGSLFHELMASFAEHYDNGTQALAQWFDRIAVFTPPVNEKTGQIYGTATKAYKDAYEAFLEEHEGKLIASQAEVDAVLAMSMSLTRDCGSTSEQVLKLLKWGEPEVSHFIEYEGCKFKWRPDLETKRKIIDWKTVSTNDLNEESINRIILKYGYHISAAMYQFFTHEQTSTWKQFLLVLVSKEPPYDCIMVDMSNYCYRYIPEVDMVSIGPGAMEFQKLLGLHIKCTKDNYWPGAESVIPDDNGVRVLEIQPPRYYQSKYIEEI